jgi:ATP-binding cassette subfamily B protein
MKSQGIIDWLNKVINESIWGAALIRVVNSQQLEKDKFVKANTEAKNNGLDILKLFTALIPVITFVASFASLVIVVLGGYFVINDSMTLGDFSAFNSYLGLLIFPIMILGFMSNVIARASSSYQRIAEVLEKPEEAEFEGIKAELEGDIKVTGVNLKFGEKPALKNVSFKIDGATRTAIIGPTAAGKTQLLYLLTGLAKPDSGTIEYDKELIEKYDKENFHKQVGIVFQDSIIFNLTLRENIAFNSKVKSDDLEKAIDTAELKDFIASLPDGLETMVSERGTSLSGGQKQRIMLARALALNPKILLLDDFTARVDAKTEAKIVHNVVKNYPGITLVSITQKIGSIHDYDQIILLMEGEILGKGTHQDLMESSPEYVQIFNSQRSTNHYELHS